MSNPPKPSKQPDEPHRVDAVRQGHRNQKRIGTGSGFLWGASVLLGGIGVAFTSAIAVATVIGVSTSLSPKEPTIVIGRAFLTGGGLLIMSLLMIYLGWIINPNSVRQTTRSDQTNRQS